MNSEEKRRASSPIRAASPQAFGTYTPPRRYSHQEAHNGSPVVYSDRHIPSRASTALSDQFEMLAHQEVMRSSRQRQSSESSSNSTNTALLNDALRSELLGQAFTSPQSSLISSAENNDPATSTSIIRSSPSLFRYRSRVSDPEGTNNRRRTSRRFSAGPYLGSAPLHSTGSHPYSAPKPPRRIARAPYKVLDAPSLQDDFYLNLLDWSASNVVAVGLGSSVYLWAAYSSKVTKLHDYGTSDVVTSIIWMNGGSHLAVGLGSGKVQVFDATALKCTRNMAGHTSRVGTLAWSTALLASGSRDRRILLQDVRIRHLSEGGGSAPVSSPGAAGFRYSGSPFSPLTSSPTPVPRSQTATLNLIASATSLTPINNRIPMSSILQEEMSYFADHSPLPPDSLPPSRPDSMEIPAWQPAGMSVLGDDNEEVVLGGYSIPPLASSGGNLQAIPASDNLWDDEGDAGSSDNDVDDRDEVDMSAFLQTLTSPGNEPRAATPPYTPAPSTLSSYASSQSIFTPPRTSSATYRSSIPTPPSARRLSAGIATSVGGSVVRSLAAHKQEVCGLKWSFDENQLASGGNDNKLLIWDIANLGPTSTEGGANTLHRFSDHTAAVKAIAWSPHQHGLLASGGGTADRNIRFWNALSGVPLHHYDTGSQVCNLAWSTHVNELVSTHGYSLNQVVVWKYPSMQKISTLTGHTFRVLYLAMAPDGQSIVTGAGDETLRFWNIFPGPQQHIGQNIGPSSLFPTMSDIR